MRLDLHVHTCFSYDCWLSLEALTKAVISRGLDGVAVLDHDEIEGALRLRDKAPFTVIVGEEIGTLHGGLGALFIEERIPPHLSAEDTIARIRKQDGLVFVPHPLSRRVPGRIEAAKLLDIIDEVDILEGFNARAPIACDDRRARDLASLRRIPVAAGSDAHFASEVGRAWAEMEGFHTAQGFLRGLSRARLHYGTKTCFLLPLLTVASIPVLTLMRRLRPSCGRGQDATHASLARRKAHGPGGKPL
jgi:predicted metal-dependent phosphoesterase TrpH